MELIEEEKELLLLLENQSLNKLIIKGMHRIDKVPSICSKIPNLEELEI
jgi:hypothetical protein